MTTNPKPTGRAVLTAPARAVARRLVAADLANLAAENARLRTALAESESRMEARILDLAARSDEQNSELGRQIAVLRTEVRALVNTLDMLRG